MNRTDLSDRGREEAARAERKIPWWLRRKDEKSDAAQEAKTPAGNYTAVSLVSTRLLNLLRENLVPELIQTQDSIGLCSPSDHSDLLLGIYLYDVRENGAARINGLLPVDQQYMQYPPMYLDLYYMITTYLTMDLRYRSEEEHRLLGGVMQLLHDSPVLNMGAGGEELRLELENLEIEEKMKLWSGFGGAYRLSLFYKASPVRLDSTLFRKVPRVREVEVKGKLM